MLEFLGVSSRRCRSATAVIALAFLHCGCGGGDAGPELYPVTGTVTYNGEPVPNASVTFQPASGPIAMGTTDAQGKYSLKTGSGDGAVAGSHKVAVVAVESTTQMDNPTPEDMANMSTQDQPAAEPKSLIPDKYATHDKSDLTAEVKSDGSGNDIPIELKD